MKAKLTLTAFCCIERYDMISRLQPCNTLSNLDHYAGTFMTQDGRECSFWIFSRQGRAICMTHASRFHFNKNFTRLRTLKIYFNYLQRHTSLKGNCCFRFNQYLSPAKLK